MSSISASELTSTTGSCAGGGGADLTTVGPLLTVGAAGRGVGAGVAVAAGLAGVAGLAGAAGFAGGVGLVEAGFGGAGLATTSAYPPSTSSLAVQPLSAKSS